MSYKVERLVAQATDMLTAFNLHPKIDPLNGDSHHTDFPCTKDDLVLGDGLAFLLGDLFITPDMTPVAQWQAVARALHLHGLTVADFEPRIGAPAQLPEESPLQTVCDLQTKAELYVRQARVGSTDEGVRFGYYEALAIVDIPAVRAEGAKAYHEGLPSHSNPYRDGTAIGDVWRTAYNASRSARA